jgi:hypothetical protein
MKLRLDKPLGFWTDIAYEDLRSDHPDLTKHQLITEILHHYEARGDAMRYLNARGGIAWKASPLFLAKLADAQRDAQDDLEYCL